MRQTKNKVSDLTEEEILDPKVYEVGYLLVPTLSEEEIPKIYGDLKEIINSFGGQIISDEMPVLIDLAYPMLKVISNVHHKFQTGYFGWVKFYLNPDQSAALKKKLDLDTNLLRFLILKTVKENTIASKRFNQKDSHRKKNFEIKKENVEEIPINKEEIDKEIDAMIQEE